MSLISFKLDSFEGPLDLLLHLISKHKLNIYDIEISLLLEQYMEYMNCLESDDYESAADFLEMAARLIYIKTCSLLPQPEEAAELKKELEGRIIEYSLCKKAASELKKIYAGGDIFVRQPVKFPVNKAYTRTHQVSVLYEAYMGISSKIKKYKPLRANVFSPIVSHRIVSVTSKIIFVLKKLYKTGECEMTRLYSGITDKSEKVATFLAVLELTKSGRIYINDDNTLIRFNRTNKNHVSDTHEKNITESQVCDNDTETDLERSELDNYSDVSDNNIHKSGTSVKFSSERRINTHTISVKPEVTQIRVLAASAFISTDSAEAKIDNNKILGISDEERSFSEAEDSDVISPAVIPKIVKNNKKLDFWRIKYMYRSFYAAHTEKNLWRYRFL
ncbi:segregation and condensation protein A [Hominimerdicola sp. 21CYCFAH17_S]